MKTFTATVERDHGWWAITIPNLPGAFSQVKRLDQVKYMARSLLADWFDEPIENFDVDVHPSLPDGVVVNLAEARNRAEEAKRLREDAAERMRTVARQLVEDEKLTIRDVGTILGVSHQRAQQLVDEARRAA